jgi:outer membrane protein TolC
MRTDRSPAVLLVCVLLGGCISTGVRDDVAAVREIAHAVAVADVSGAVDDVAAPDVTDILSTPLSADAAVRIALVNNRELRARLRELGVARGRVLQAGLLPNPLVDAELSPERQTGLALRVEYDLAGFVLAPMRSEAAYADLDVARFEAAGMVIETGYHVRDAFHELLAREESLAVAQRQLDALAAARDAAHALAAAGNLRALDVVARDAAYEEERVHVAEMELAVLVAREHVQRLLGLHGEETAWTTTGPLAAVPTDESDPPDLERRAIDASLELRAMQSRMVGAARRAGLARAEGVLPELLLDVHALVGDPTSGAGVTLGGGLGVRLPIFDRGDGRVAAYEHQLDAWFERYVGLAIDVRSSARESRARVLSARGRAAHYATVVLPARQRVLDETLLQYDAMQVSVFQLLDALRMRQETELAAIETRHEYWSAAAALDALLAGQRVDAAETTSMHTGVTPEGDE